MTLKTRLSVLLVTTDPDLERAAGSAIEGERDLALTLAQVPLAAAEAEIERLAPRVVVLDVGAADPTALEILRRLVRVIGEDLPIVVAVDALEPEAARTFLRLKLSDLILKPAKGTDLLRSIRRALGSDDEVEASASQIFTFVPATGGAGNTTLALQTAFLLHEASARKRLTTCVVDLNLQHGSCAEYLDLEPRFDITDIENQPDRLDRQLLEAMLSRHTSGLAVISAPPCPWEPRSFKPELVTRLLDLVATYFDNVVIDMPRTWFPWTDSILTGSDRIFVVTEMTVPALRHTQRLTGAVRERVGAQARVGVIVNRSDAKGAASGLREADIREVLGDSYAGRVANNYPVVRQALDRGIPVRDIAADCDVLNDLRRIVLPGDARPAEGARFRMPGLSWLAARKTAAAAR